MHPWVCLFQLKVGGPRLLYHVRIVFIDKSTGAFAFKICVPTIVFDRSPHLSAFTTPPAKIRRHACRGAADSERAAAGEAAGGRDGAPHGGVQHFGTRRGGRQVGVSHTMSC